MRSIYKISDRMSWAAAEAAGLYTGSAHDERDGFIHFSTAAQARETAARHFAGQHDLIIAAIEPQRLGSALTWEPARNGDLFPHLYASLPMSAVAWTKPLPLGADGAHVFPQEVQ